MEKWLRLALIAASTLGYAGLAMASENADAMTSCMEVEVNGERAPSFSCLTQKLSGTAGAARSAPATGPASETIVQRPSNQLGLFNRSATSQRMGNTFGTSVYPQRPEKSIAGPPIIPHAVP